MVTSKKAKLQAQDSVPAKDKVHEWANLVVGFHFPRWWIRQLTKKRRYELALYVRSMWLRANDNNVKKIPRPKWCPKKYVYGR